FPSLNPALCQSVPYINITIIKNTASNEPRFVVCSAACNNTSSISGDLIYTCECCTASCIATSPTINEMHIRILFIVGK
ncbi:hypothetical protein L9F63_012210, partial [Diploptera punctata]